MNAFLLMLPGILTFAFIGLAAFIWALKAGQFDDPKGDAVRVLLNHERPDSDNPA